MHRQAIRATARRRRRAASAPPFRLRISWSDIGGFLAMSAFTALAVGVALGWAAGIDRWPWWAS